MPLIGVDTSGKIGEGNLFIAAVEYRKTDFLERLRKKVRKRNPGIASRRRIKANELNDIELQWIARNFNANYNSTNLPITGYASLKRNLLRVPAWKFKTLAAAIFLTAQELTKEGDVMLIDRDYSENVMPLVLENVKVLFEKGNKHVIVESGTSYNEVIALADLIAGCSRRKAVQAKELNAEEILKVLHPI